MRCLLLACSLGIVMLQQQASLPSPWHAVYALLPALVAIGCAVYSGRAAGARRSVGRAAALLIAAFSVGMAGFFSAAWRADTRLADALPTAWEGQDIEPVGIVDDLPQPADRGTRFAFAVEKIPPTPSCRRACRSPGTTGGLAMEQRREQREPRPRSPRSTPASAGHSPCGSSGRMAPSTRMASTSRGGSFKTNFARPAMCARTTTITASMHSPRAPPTMSRAPASRYARGSWVRSRAAAMRESSPPWRSETSARFPTSSGNCSTAPASAT